ncbi:sialate O-acetylesterase [Ancylobacter lacus]|uniref:sialate O-acetylesterase n=1 Tax=Ancylobacter lacus TaxID=2579970 RepID=UPI001BD08F7E
MPPSRDLSNMAQARRWTSLPMAGIQRPVADINTLVVYGQSLATGQQAWPALSQTPRFGNLMLGGDVRPLRSDSTSFDPVPPPGFQPLVAHVRMPDSPAILDAAQVAALPRQSIALGESPAVGAANMLASLLQRHPGGAKGLLNVVCPAVSGTTIAQLSRQNSQDGRQRYNRVLSSVQQAHAAARQKGLTHVVPATLYIQGEFDSIPLGHSRLATRELYREALERLWRDLTADIRAITGQQADPLFVIHQVGGTFACDVDMNGEPGLHVAEAQLDFACAHPTQVVMAGPVYQLPDRGGHLTANGSRWFGQMLGRAIYRSGVEGYAWRPLSPTRISAVAPRRLLVDFHVPAPPLRFAPAYLRCEPVLYPTRGFRITGPGGGDIAVTAVDLVGDTTVAVTTRDPVRPGFRLWYGSADASDGGGNLCDSDAALPSLDSYDYIAGSGMTAAENIAELVGRPYPSANWCVSFCQPVEAG